MDVGSTQKCSGIERKRVPVSLRIPLENDINKRDKGEKHALCQPELPDADGSVHTGHRNSHFFKSSWKISRACLS